MTAILLIKCKCKILIDFEVQGTSVSIHLNHEIVLYECRVFDLTIDDCRHPLQPLTYRPHIGQSTQSSQAHELGLAILTLALGCGN
jgi:hypothetical protein